MLQEEIEDHAIQFHRDNIETKMQVPNTSQQNRIGIKKKPRKSH